MTLVGYYNALRELGGARRLIEDEVRNRLIDYSKRKRIGEAEGLFADRIIDYEPVELTSRESTARVSEAKRRLALLFGQDKAVHVAIATNMISVGLEDITRLGLMRGLRPAENQCRIYSSHQAAFGPRREPPGLGGDYLQRPQAARPLSLRTLRELSRNFLYRSVEVTSVTPFSPRALDRGLAGTG